MNKAVRLIFGFIIVFCNAVFALPSVAFFYGQTVPTLQLCQYDLVVVDPYSNFNPREYCTSISEPLAYVSLGEVGRGVAYEKDIQPQWVAGTNAAWNNNKVMDQTQPGWQEFFLTKLIDPLWDQGYRGFFLDTLDSFFLVTHTTEQQQTQIDALVHIIQEIKKRHPEAKIILNRGFQLLPKLHTEVNAVVIESLYNSWNQEKGVYEPTPAADQRMLFTEIDKIRHMQLPIVIIDYLPPDQENKALGLADTLQKQGFIPWITDKTLQAIYLNKLKSVARKILIIIEGKGDWPLEQVTKLSYINLILEYMGYTAEYFNLDATAAPPEKNLAQEYAGIIFHITTESPKNEPLIHWAQKQRAAKIPIIFINNFTVPRDSKVLTQLNMFFTPIDSPSTKVNIIKSAEQLVGYEATPLTTPFEFNPVHTDASQVWLQLENNQKKTEDAIAITPWGGYALSPYFIQYLPNYRALWVLNPFEFFRQGLRLQEFPIPDVTTENGRRLMSVHIDGDGFSLMAKWIGGHFAAQELLTHILKKFPIPTSVSVITGEIAPNGVNPKQSPELMSIARQIFALPWVESASHSFSHPFNWENMTNKDRQIQGESYTLSIPNYHFDLETEITGSVDFINKFLSPAGRTCRLIFWSGMANPSLKALAIAARAHLLNINGLADTYITNFQPSLTGVQPMGMKVGDYTQVFAPIDGDFYYIHDFTGPLYGYKQVIQTLQLTDKPRRLKPIDLYYHIYAAAYPATLETVIQVYQWALAQSVMNIYISDYIKKVLDYFHVELVRKNDLWIIHTSGALREFRSPASFGYPNLQKSQNVIGFRRINNELYLHVGPNPYTVLSYQKKQPTVAYLVEANGRVSAFTRSPKELIIQLQGYLPLQFTLANVSHCQVVANNPLKITHNQDGTISYSSLKERDEIHINC